MRISILISYVQMSKLTLSIDPRVVTRAKQFAKRQGTSVSSMVETYLAVVTKPPAPRKPTPLTQSLLGSLKSGDIEDYKKHLVAKYL